MCQYIRFLLELTNSKGLVLSLLAASIHKSALFLTSHSLETVSILPTELKAFAHFFQQNSFKKINQRSVLVLYQPVF